MKHDNNTLCCSSSTICDWSRMTTSTSPYTFHNCNDENLQIISDLCDKNPNAVFLRKVSKHFPDEILETLCKIK